MVASTVSPDNNDKAKKAIKIAIMDVSIVLDLILSLYI
jgi:hypothetical protein